MVSEVIGGACALELSLSRAIICPRLKLNSGFCNESWRTTHVVVLIPDLIFILSQRLGKIQVLDDIRNGLCLGFPWRVDTKFGLGRQSFERPQRDDRYTRSRSRSDLSTQLPSALSLYTHWQLASGACLLSMVWCQT